MNTLTYIKQTVLSSDCIRNIKSSHLLYMWLYFRQCFQQIAEPGSKFSGITQRQWSKSDTMPVRFVAIRVTGAGGSILPRFTQNHIKSTHQLFWRNLSQQHGPGKRGSLRLLQQETWKRGWNALEGIETWVESKNSLGNSNVLWTIWKDVRKSNLVKKKEIKNGWKKENGILWKKGKMDWRIAVRFKCVFRTSKCLIVEN